MIEVCSSEVVCVGAVAWVDNGAFFPDSWAALKYSRKGTAFSRPTIVEASWNHFSVEETVEETVEAGVHRGCY